MKKVGKVRGTTGKSRHLGKRLSFIAANSKRILESGFSMFLALTLVLLFPSAGIATGSDGVNTRAAITTLEEAVAEEAPAPVTTPEPPPTPAPAPTPEVEAPASDPTPEVEAPAPPEEAAPILEETPALEPEPPSIPASDPTQEVEAPASSEEASPVVKETPSIQQERTPVSRLNGAAIARTSYGLLSGPPRFVLEAVDTAGISATTPITPTFNLVGSEYKSDPLAYDPVKIQLVDRDGVESAHEFTGSEAASAPSWDFTLVGSYETGISIDSATGVITVPDNYEYSQYVFGVSAVFNFNPAGYQSEFVPTEVENSNTNAAFSQTFWVYLDLPDSSPAFATDTVTVASTLTSGMAGNIYVGPAGLDFEVNVHMASSKTGFSELRWELYDASNVLADSGTQSLGLGAGDTSGVKYNDIVNQYGSTGILLDISLPASLVTSLAEGDYTLKVLATPRSGPTPIEVVVDNKISVDKTPPKVTVGFTGNPASNPPYYQNVELLITADASDIDAAKSSFTYNQGASLITHYYDPEFTSFGTLTLQLNDASGHSFDGAYKGFNFTGIVDFAGNRAELDLTSPTSPPNDGTNIEFFIDTIAPTITVGFTPLDTSDNDEGHYRGAKLTVYIEDENDFNTLYTPSIAYTKPDSTTGFMAATTARRDEFSLVTDPSSAANDGEYKNFTFSGITDAAGNTATIVTLNSGVPIDVSGVRSESSGAEVSTTASEIGFVIDTVAPTVTVAFGTDSTDYDRAGGYYKDATLQVTTDAGISGIKSGSKVKNSVADRLIDTTNITSALTYTANGEYKNFDFSQIRDRAGNAVNSNGVTLKSGMPISNAEKTGYELLAGDDATDGNYDNIAFMINNVLPKVTLSFGSETTGNDVGYYQDVTLTLKYDSDIPPCTGKDGAKVTYMKDGDREVWLAGEDGFEPLTLSASGTYDSFDFSAIKDKSGNFIENVGIDTDTLSTLPYFDSSIVDYSTRPSYSPASLISNDIGFVIDTQAPTVTVGFKNGTTGNDDGYYQSAELTFTLNDDISGIKTTDSGWTYSFAIDDKAQTISGTTPTSTLTFGDDNDGKYSKFDFTGITDRAGNSVEDHDAGVVLEAEVPVKDGTVDNYELSSKSAVANKSGDNGIGFVIDNKEPTASILLNSVSDQIFYDGSLITNEGVTVQLKGTDSVGLKSAEWVKIAVDDLTIGGDTLGGLDFEELRGLSGSDNRRGGDTGISQAEGVNKGWDDTLDDTENDRYLYVLKVTNRAGLSDFTASAGVINDLTDPEISFNSLDNTNKRLDPNQYAGDVTARFTVSEDTNSRSSASYIFIKGEKLQVPVNSGLQEANYTVFHRVNGSDEPLETNTPVAGSKKTWTDNPTWDEIVANSSNTNLSVTIPTSAYNNFNNLWVRVTVADHVGNTSFADTAVFDIDASGPKVTVVYADEGSVQNEKYFNMPRTATITVTDAHLANIESDIIITTEGVISGWSSAAPTGERDIVSRTATVRFATDGDYTLTLFGSDDLGNTANDISYEGIATDGFTIDMTNPILRVSYDNESVLNGKYFKAARVGTITVEEHNFSDAGANINTNGGIGGWGGAGDTHTCPVSYSTDGEYNFHVDYTDLAGNPANVVPDDNFIIDLTNPTLDFVGVVQNMTAFNTSDITPMAQARDINYDANGIELTLNKVQWNQPASLIEPLATRSSIDNGQQIDVGAHNANSGRLGDGIYTLLAKVIDLAGNEFENQIIYSVNRFGSTWYIVDGSETEAVLLKYYTNTPTDIEVHEINATEVKNQKVSITNEGKVTELDGGRGYSVGRSGNEVSWNDFTYRINATNFANEGIYGITIYSEDAAGNTSTNRAPKSDEANPTDSLPVDFAYDKTPPAIVLTGVDEHGRYTEASRVVTLDVADNFALDTVDVYIDDSKSPRASFTAEDFEAANGKVQYTMNASNETQTIRVEARDMATNNSEAVTASDIFINPNSFLQFMRNTPLFVGTIVGMLVLIIAGIALILYIRSRRRDAVERARA